MPAPTIEVGEPFNLTATGVVGATARPASFLGFYVNSTTAGTLVLRNKGSGSSAVTGTITPAVGWHAFPMSYPGGLHATIGGTLDVTFIVLAGQA